MNADPTNCILLKSLESFGRIVFTAKGIINKLPTNSTAKIRKPERKPTFNKDMRLNQLRTRNQIELHHPISSSALLKQQSSHPIEISSFSRIKNTEPIYPKPATAVIHQLAALFLAKQMYHRNYENNRSFYAQGSKCNKNFVYHSGRSHAIKSRSSNCTRLKRIDIVMPFFKNTSLIQHS
jgi:hypothetical protein